MELRRTPYSIVSSALFSQLESWGIAGIILENRVSKLKTELRNGILRLRNANIRLRDANILLRDANMLPRNAKILSRNGILRLRNVKIPLLDGNIRLRNGILPVKTTKIEPLFSIPNIILGMKNYNQKENSAPLNAGLSKNI
jgi:hypothetical protein